MNDQTQIGFDFDLTVEEAAVLRNLPRGREHAVSMPVLAERVGVSTRALQDIIAHLIEEHNTLICSACGRNHGYYLPADEAEYRAGVNQLIHRVRSIAKRIRALDRRAYEQLFGQGQLEMKA